MKPTKLIRLYKWFYNCNCQFNEFKLTNVVLNSQVYTVGRGLTSIGFLKLSLNLVLDINRMTLKLSEVLKGGGNIFWIA